MTNLFGSFSQCWSIKKPMVDTCGYPMVPTSRARSMDIDSANWSPWTSRIERTNPSGWSTSSKLSVAFFINHKSQLCWWSPRGIGFWQGNRSQKTWSAYGTYGTDQGSECSWSSTFLRPQGGYVSRKRHVGQLIALLVDEQRGESCRPNLADRHRGSNYRVVKQIPEVQWSKHCGS